MHAIGPDKLALSDVANTALLTAFCRAHETLRPQPLLVDRPSAAIVERLTPLLERSPSRLHRRLAAGKLRDDMVVHIALRARQYDAYARDFLARRPGGWIVNLGCGLDTRFWRLDEPGERTVRLIDLDLPEMIALRREFVGETDRYRMFPSSVLDHRWMDRVARQAAGAPLLFLAEGLFMYLPQAEVEALVVALRARFPGSELVFEAVNRRWLRPAMRWMIRVKMRYELGLGPDTDYRFGIADSREPESWTPGIRLLGEWVYLDVDEPRIGPIRRLRGLSIMRHTQWTARYALGEPPPADSGYVSSDM
ncbi:MAG: class I SAM-dependent methyltransferase [Nannocystaceae bacterium]